MSDPEQEPVEAAPEGAHCAVHPERPALVTCPRCGAYCCIICWHNTVRRCHACLQRDPGQVLPWEDRRRPWPIRLFGTLGTAFRPNVSAPAFATGDWRSGVSFAILSALTLALASGVIPFTHTLAFGPTFRVQVLGSPDPSAIALDVTVAALLGLLVSAAQLLALGVPYVSLCRAYGERGHPPAALRTVLYRGWLVPAGNVLRSLADWGMPADGSVALAAMILSLVPLILLMSSMIASARMASGVGPLASMVVVLIPVVLLMLVEPLTVQLLQPWLPDSESIRQALEATAAASGASR